MFINHIFQVLRSQAYNSKKKEKISQAKPGRVKKYAFLGKPGRRHAGPTFKFSLLGGWAFSKSLPLIYAKTFYLLRGPLFFINFCVEIFVKINPFLYIIYKNVDADLSSCSVLTILTEFPCFLRLPVSIYK